MKFGVALPHFGPGACPEAMVEVAQKAELFGFDSVWALDRLLWPLKPTSRYPGNPRGELPAVMQNTYDPLVALTFVAACTRKVRLGTSVLVASYRSPILVAKMGASLDQLSGGRFILGLGAGWSADEFSVSGQSLEERHRYTDEYLRVLRELWIAEEPSFAGKYYQIPKSIFLPRPLQKPHPPIWIGGNSKRALRRAAELGDGWHPTQRVKPSAMAEEIKCLRRLAEKAGRSPDAVQATLRWNVSALTRTFSGNEVAETLRQYRQAGVRHVCFDFNIPQPSSRSAILEAMERLMREAVPQL
jgi:probable F420-dependent oxidoreductase